MVNFIWLALIVLGVIVAGTSGKIEIVTLAALEGANNAVKTSLNLIAIINFWLGIMKLAEAAGLVQCLARLTRPLLRFLFPEIPQNHPAFGAIYDPTATTP